MRKEYEWLGSTCFLPCVGKQVSKGDSVFLNDYEAESLKKQKLVKPISKDSKVKEKE